MKRLISWMLILVFLFGLIGCGEQTQEPQGIAFYYCLAEPDYNAGNAALTAEYRTGVAQEELSQALELYLKGPLSSEFQSPFPQDLRLVVVYQDNSTVYLTFSGELATLTGLDLTIACSCLTLTTLAITGAEQVEIRTVAGLLDGQRAIRMNKNTLLLLDTVQEEE